MTSEKRTNTPRKLSLRFGHFLVVLWFAILGLGVQSSPEPAGPDDTNASGKDTEMALFYRWVTINGDKGNFWGDYGELQQKLESAFKKAGTSVAYKDGGGEDISDHPTPTWMFQYYQNMKNTLGNYPYFVCGIPYETDGVGKKNLNVMGFSNPAGGLNPGTPKGEKWSFIMKEAVEKAYEEPPRQDQPGVVIKHKAVFAYTLIHELGHVRAQLRHVAGNTFDHTEGDKVDLAHCIMHQFLTKVWFTGTRTTPDKLKIISYMGFCGEDSDPEDDESTCIQYLEQANNP